MTEFEKNYLLAKVEQLLELFDNLQKQVEALETEVKNK